MHARPAANGDWIGSADWDPSRRSRCQKDALGQSAVYISAKQISYQALNAYVVGGGAEVPTGRRQNGTWVPVSHRIANVTVKVGAPADGCLADRLRRNETRPGDHFVVTVFALGAALLYGCADFLGGVATRQARVLSILPASALAGLLIVLVAALASGEPPRLAGVAWGLAAGGVGGVGLIVFYDGLAAGPMTVVAPTSALTATVLPVAVSIAEGERASPVVYAGALICLVAVVLVSAAGSPAAESPTARTREASTGRAVAGLVSRLARRGFHSRAVLFGLTAGATFGLFFLFLRNAGQSGAFWPIVASRLTGFLVVVVAATVTRSRPVIASGGTRLLLATFGSGTLDATANVSYVLATRAGLFGLAVVLTSLYPGVTVVLARFVLGERLRPTQLIGLLLAAAGVLMVTV